MRHKPRVKKVRSEGTAMPWHVDEGDGWHSWHETWALALDRALELTRTTVQEVCS